MESVETKCLTPCLTVSGQRALQNKSQFTESHCSAPRGELLDDLETYATICVNANFLFSFLLSQQNKTINTNPGCRQLLYVPTYRHIDGAQATAGKDKHHKDVKNVHLKRLGIVSALRKAVD